ncbi:MAG TPA: alpha/beta hydrolase [Solirubrobacterales bacterium]
MAASPRLPSSVEYRILHSFCRLPPRVQHRLFGPPPEIDGQVLASDLHVLMALAARVGDSSLTGSLPPEEARAFVRKAVASSSGPPIPMAQLLKFEIPGPASMLRARLYVPFGAPPPPRPMLVHFHGGGWMVGDLDTHDSVCRFLAAHSGAAVLSSTYRLAPEHPFPAAVEDAQAAFRWAFALTAELGADPRRIAVGGDSAGANLAAGVCIAMRDSDGPQAAMQLLIYPATDAIEPLPSRRLFSSGFKLTQADIDHCQRAYLPDEAMGYEPLASILRAPDLSNLPPAYVATAGFDPLRDEGEAFAARMKAEGVRVAFRRHPRLLHTFANLTSVSRSSRAAMLEAAGALRMGLAYSY